MNCQYGGWGNRAIFTRRWSSSVTWWDVYSMLSNDVWMWAILKGVNNLISYATTSWSSAKTHHEWWGRYYIQEDVDHHGDNDDEVDVEWEDGRRICQLATRGCWGGDERMWMMDEEDGEIAFVSHESWSDGISHNHLISNLFMWKD